MVETARAALAGAEAWIVGGAIRDELLGRPVVDLDVACADPQAAARAYVRIGGGARFPLSERHGAWRIALDDGRTVDFTPLRDGIDHDLATRDFTVNAIARPLDGGADFDPFRGRDDLDRRVIRAVSAGVFADDPLRLLRAVRLEDELGFALDEATEQLVRSHAHLVDRPSGERVLGELRRLSPAGFERLAELGLLEPLGGSTARFARLRAVDRAEFRLVVAFGAGLARLPISNELRRYAAALLRAEPPPDRSPRALHRFRRVAEPWATEAAAFLGRPDPADVEAARRRDPPGPLLRGDELGVPAGPEVGRLLELIAEERAAGTIATREEALALVRREAPCR